MKNQINFKSDLGEIKKENPNLKSKDQISDIKNVQFFFWFKRKIIDFFRNYSFFYPKLNTKQNIEGVSSIKSQTNASKITNSTCTSKSR